MFRRLAFVALLAAACGGRIQPDDDVATRTIGTYEGDPNDPSSGRDPVEDGGMLVVSPGSAIGADACKGTTAPLHTDFESGNIADSFTVNEPTAFTVDATNPIDGAHSLAVDSDAHSYLAYKVGQSCSVLVTFDVRLSTQTIASGTKLVAVATGLREFTLVVDPGGAAHLDQALITDLGTTTMPGSPLTTLVANVAMSVLVKVDITSASAIANIVPDVDGGAPGGYQQQAFLSGASGAGAVVEVDFGSSPDFGTKGPLPNGTYWLDDIAIE